VHAIDKDTPIKRARARYGDDMMVMMTTRSHDQYNTTIYGLDDRYRGVFGLRRVVFIHPADRARLGFAEGEHVDITSVWEDGVTRHVQDFRLVDYDIPRVASARTIRRPIHWCRWRALATDPAPRRRNRYPCCCGARADRRQEHGGSRVWAGRLRRARDSAPHRWPHRSRNR
jgi:anaerobic selenocysteine-containing dehydrogenase